MKSRILVVEDEPSILDNIMYSLETDGFEPKGCATVGEARGLLQEGGWDLVVLDVGLPDTSGFEFCKEVRRLSSVPIIFLTARAGEIDRVVGLEIGADDYMVKPFSPRELSARVKAVLRRGRILESGPEPTGWSTGQAFSTKIEPRVGSGGEAVFRVDSDRAQILFHGVRLGLSGTEFRLLKALCDHPGRVYSRAQLMEIAWDDPGTALERTVDAHIKSLRAKLKDVRADADPIETLRGFGYSIRENA